MSGLSSTTATALSRRVLWSPTVFPEGTVIMNHAQERTVGTPLNERSGRRGGTHNSLTRITIKPLHVAGGYGHLTYGFNYIGPTGNNRDEVTRIRRRSQEVQY